MDDSLVECLTKSGIIKKNFLSSNPTGVKLFVSFTNVVGEVYACFHLGLVDWGSGWLLFSRPTSERQAFQLNNL